MISKHHFYFNHNFTIGIGTFKNEYDSVYDVMLLNDYNYKYIQARE